MQSQKSPFSENQLASFSHEFRSPTIRCKKKNKRFPRYKFLHFRPFPPPVSSSSQYILQRWSYHYQWLFCISPNLILRTKINSLFFAMKYCNTIKAHPCIALTATSTISLSSHFRWLKFQNLSLWTGYLSNNSESKIDECEKNIFTLNNNKAMKAHFLESENHKESTLQLLQSDSLQK